MGNEATGGVRVNTGIELVVFHVFVINAHYDSEIIVYITIIKQVHLKNLI